MQVSLMKENKLDVKVVSHKKRYYNMYNVCFESEASF